MKNNFYFAILLLKKLGVLLLVYFLMRIGFYLYNAHFFAADTITITDWFKIIAAGIVFDISAICYTNAPIILLHTLPFSFRYNTYYQYFVNGLYYIINIIVLILAVADFETYQFVLKRSTANLLVIMQNDVNDKANKYLTDYWQLTLFVIFCLFLMYKLMPKVKKHQKPFEQNFVLQFVIMIIMAGLSVIGMRGGFDLKPISSLTATKWVQNYKLAVLATNTPFTIIRSLGKVNLQEKTYFPETEISNFFTTKNELNNTQTPDKSNVIIIILESFSKEYIGGYNGKANTNNSFTPFIDSLMGKSLVFSNTYANGKQSNQGVPAILASIPTLMENPFIASAYQDNHINSIASVLQAQNYASSAFFHGAKNGSLNLDSFALQAGFKKYFGKTQYFKNYKPAQKTDDDGYWGIFDEPFLQYMSQQLKQMPQPFCASVFTLSSHHPYTVPPQYQNLKQGEIPILRNVTYTDLALRHFFKSIENETWYNNTLFVIVADHAGPPRTKFAESRVGRYQIPLIFFKPNKLQNPEYNHTLTEQLDIVPTILDFLHIQTTYNGFGQSALRDTLPNHTFAITYMDNLYQIITDKCCLNYHEDAEQIESLYNYTTDSLLKDNILNTQKQTADSLANTLKAVIQTYNKTLIKNTL